MRFNQNKVDVLGLILLLFVLIGLPLGIWAYDSSLWQKKSPPPTKYSPSPDILIKAGFWEKFRLMMSLPTALKNQLLKSPPLRSKKAIEWS